MTDIIDFEASDSHDDFAGRGTIFTGPSPMVMDRDRPEIIGRQVRIHGKVYTVKLVERFMPRVPIGIGESIGLLV